jgi:hypothetical protein
VGKPAETCAIRSNFSIIPYIYIHMDRGLLSALFMLCPQGLAHRRHSVEYLLTAEIKCLHRKKGLYVQLNMQIYPAKFDCRYQGGEYFLLNLYFSHSVGDQTQGLVHARQAL